MSVTDYRKRSKFIKITAIVIALVFGLTLFMGVAAPFFGNPDKAEGNGEISAADVWQPQQKEVTTEEPGQSAGAAAKYTTITRKGDIDIGVNYLNPLSGDKDTLAFEIIIGTQSVDIKKYKDIRKYVELRTDKGLVISDGFEWVSDNSESHHIGGVLEIKNSIAGNPIVGPDTKSFRLVFKNIGGDGEREHVYEGDMLK